MKLRLLAVAAVLALAGCGATGAAVRAPVVPSTSEVPALLEAAARGEAVGERLRLLGPDGLSKVVAAYDAEADPVRKQHLSDTMDAVAQQKDARYTRLYWYTDLAEAERASKESGRPILSLRLLGRLDEELSCANSRFFRTALYPNDDVRAMLRDEFVLHWSSERPAPVMTIDFGDGRVVKRTVTGNSIHYVLDAEGRVVDAIPGLLGPQAFVAAATRARDLATRTAGMSDWEAAVARASWHTSELERLRQAWPRELARVGLTAIAFPPNIPTADPPKRFNTNARLAVPIAPSKAAVERPLVTQIVAAPRLAQVAESIPWRIIARTQADACHLDAHAKEAMESKHTGWWSRRVKAGPQRQELEGDDARDMELAFEGTMAEDTARNEYLYHAVIHHWLSSRDAQAWDQLNARVYEELFATPADDPWLGLMPPAAYSGLEDDGIMKR